jgi:primosomal protein N' (replication factor Y)
MNIVRVAIDVPVPTLFDYRADDLLSDDIGQRVVVPFGKKHVVGVVTATAVMSSVAPERLKSVVRVLREIPPLSTNDLRLLKFAAAYYHHSLGATIMGALPGALRRTTSPRGSLTTNYKITPAGTTADGQTLPQRAKVQRRLLASFKDARVLDTAAIKSTGPAAAAALKGLITRGWVRAEQSAASPEQPLPEPAIAGGPQPTSEQAAAVTAITSVLGRFEAFVLFGVTGSGKTEVYLQSIAAALRARQQALLLVPEIGLTPQLEALVRTRFPATNVAVLHSGLNEGERLRQWCAAQVVKAGVVLGTRLAVFAPMPRLGLIIVDEEHDTSFKQMDTLRYSARDLAVVRAKQLDVPVVLGSATPALETYHNAITGRYRLLQLTHRVGAVMPYIDCINTRGERLDEGLSLPLLEGIVQR